LRLKRGKNWDLKFEFDYKIPSCCRKANYSEDFHQNGCFWEGNQVKSTGKPKVWPCAEVIGLKIEIKAELEWTKLSRNKINHRLKKSNQHGCS
jgi:hypothetical protein